MFNLNFSVKLKPTYCNGWPMINFRIDDEVIYHGLLETTRIFNIDKNIDIGPHAISIQLLGKTNDNSSLECDQSIEIEYVSFENIHADRFVWEGKYSPSYPEPWASQQTAAGIMLEPVINNSTYLGWNGIWRLDFSTPIFAWIHRIEKLGWIYD